MKKRIKKSLKTSNGITLIALVITIIVLLILAGISISMLTGNNSILQKATDAKNNTERASVIEQARTDVLGYQAENKGIDLEKTQLKSVLETYFKDVPTELPDGEELSNLELTTLDKYGTHQIKVHEIYNGSLAESNDGILASNVGIDMYGKVVNYGINIDTSLNDCWKIFYADSNNIYLITDSYINVSHLPQKELNSISYSYIASDRNFSAKFGEHVSDNDIPNGGIFPLYASVNKNDYQKFNKDFYNSFKDINEAWDKANVMAVNSMIDTSFWSNLGDENAEYVIGGPTIEMLFNSYNKKNDESCEYRVCIPPSDDVGTYGYQVKTNSTWRNIGYLTNTDDDLYVCERQYNNEFGYWIASPGCKHPNHMLGVSWNGRYWRMGR